MPFFGREQQLRSLLKLYEGDNVRMGLVYGRRRIGKSELIKQSLRNTRTRSIYYECKQTTQQNNVGSLSALVSEVFMLPPLGFSSMEQLLEYLFTLAEKETLILVLDEYPYLRETVNGLDSILQVLIDRFHDTSKLKLVICGSFVEVMKSLLMTENPLFGRVDLTIKLKPLDYFEASMFYPEFSNEDKVRLYSIFGGIPYYNKYIDPSLSVRDNIMQLVASSGARFENEVNMYLRTEISKLNNANEAFDALARGYSRYNDILSQSHISSSPALADVLEHLMKMELVMREAPINDETNKRKTGYYISDNLSLFWYKYCFRYMSQMSVLDPEVFYDRYVAKDFESEYVPHAFETICKQYLIRKNKAGNLPVLFDKIGKYYYDDPKTHTNGEFDVVTQDPRGYIFYEAKFRSEPVTQALIEEEIAQVKQTGLQCYRYGFFSRSGFSTENAEDLILINLDDLYS